MNKRKQKFYLPFKRLLDILFSLVFIVVLLFPMFIIMIITWVSVKTNPFFIQRRIGRNKKEFTILKFRSMKKSAPVIPTPMITDKEMKEYCTKWGFFMRRTYIDEWPNLFNIFIGQMSFVGPRPGAASDEEELIQERDSVTPNPFIVRPGLTGLAQIDLHNRRHTLKEKAEKDAEYVRDISLGKDTSIIFRSLFRRFK